MPWSRTASAPGPIEPARARTGTMERSSELCDSDGRLAECALSVDGPFAGQAQVGVLEPLGQLDRIDDELDAGLELAAGKSNESPAQPAGGA